MVCETKQVWLHSFDSGCSSSFERLVLAPFTKALPQTVVVAQQRIRNKQTNNTYIYIYICTQSLRINTTAHRVKLLKWCMYPHCKRVGNEPCSPMFTKHEHVLNQLEQHVQTFPTNVQALSDELAHIQIHVHIMIYIIHIHAYTLHGPGPGPGPSPVHVLCNYTSTCMHVCPYIYIYI